MSTLETSSLHTRVITAGDRVVALRRSRLRLEVARGSDRKLKKDSGEDRVVVGTHPACDLVLTDPSVSRQHLEILLVAGGYLVRDLDSTNGTYLGDVRIHEIVLASEARLRLGDTVLRLAPLRETTDVPLSPEARFGPLLGESPAMRALYGQLARVAPTDTTVLITGESGTGKEVTARALHEASRRADKPFVVVDCGALSPTLVESELYGHLRGAFTGADRARVGAFETASGGTLFLDEIGELPLELQPRLLGALERRRIQPLGSAESRPIDVRLIAATNRNLRREVNRGNFREDLFFRLAVVSVEMPPLRERPEDIPLYVEQFLEELGGDPGRFNLDGPALERLTRRPWPGNVRELRNLVERAVALGEDGLAPTDASAPATAEANLAFPVDPHVPYKTAKALLLEQFERRYVEGLMSVHGGNMTRAARAAEIDRIYLLRLLDKFGLRATRQSG